MSSVAWPVEVGGRKGGNGVGVLEVCALWVGCVFVFVCVFECVCVGGYITDSITDSLGFSKCIVHMYIGKK